MATQTKKSPDNARKPNRKAIFLKVSLALICLLGVFLVTQQDASTQQVLRSGGGDSQIEMVNGFAAVKGSVIVGFTKGDYSRDF